VVPGGIASYPFDNTGNATDAGFHPVAPFSPDETPFGALVVQEIPGPLLTVAELAAQLRVSRATVYRLVQVGWHLRVDERLGAVLLARPVA
jgi:hypothetical protein